jgi:hypothetical protein
MEKLNDSEEEDVIFINVEDQITIFVLKRCINQGYARHRTCLPGVGTTIAKQIEVISQGLCRSG